MSTKQDVREFLVSRRARVTPEQAGIGSFGERRVPGLRREEVAMLAGVSLDYYVRLERGNIRGASESVLHALARVLRLDDAEQEYLFDLARTAPAAVSKRKPSSSAKSVRSSVQRVLDNMTVPAVVHDAAQTIIAANVMGRALYAPLFEGSEAPNFARFQFLDTRAREFYVDLPLARRTSAAMLRLEAGRDPLNAELTALVGELSTRSPDFRQEWARHDVHQHITCTKSFRHPLVGQIAVTFDAFAMPGETGLMLITYSAPPGTDTADKLALLASWAAGSEPGQQATAASAREETLRQTHRRATSTPEERHG